MTQFITALVAAVRNCALDILNSVPGGLKQPALSIYLIQEPNAIRDLCSPSRPDAVVGPYRIEGYVRAPQQRHQVLPRKRTRLLHHPCVRRDMLRVPSAVALRHYRLTSGAR